MKILQVTHGFPPETTGGTERALEAWCRALQQLGHEVTVLSGSTNPGDPARIDREDMAGLPVLRLHRDDLYYENWWKCWAPAPAAAFARVLAELRPEVVHVHHWLRLSSDLLRLAREAGCATAVTLHDHWSVLASPVRAVGTGGPVAPAVPPPLGEAERQEAFALHRADFLAEIAAAQVRFVPCEAHGQSLRDLGLAPFGDTLRPLPPPLLTVPARGADAGGGGPASERLRLLCWGSLYPDKGLHVVLDALRRAGAGAGLELTVLGEAHDPDYRARLRQLADGLPVHWGGAFATADLERAARQADLALLPTLCHESYGMVLDEALCLGLPVLCADVPAYRSRLPAGAGLAYPPADADALAGVLRDRARLQGLQRPSPPALLDAAASAAVLAECYDRAVAGEAASTPDVAAVTDAMRARAQFRRAERLYWSALQRQPPAAAPDDLLRG